MNMLCRQIIGFIGVFFLGNTYALANNTEALCISKSTKIDQKLACLNNLQFKETTNATTPIGIRQFELLFTQPIDHLNPSVGTFKQLVILYHRNEKEPMVLQTSGYNIYAVGQTSIMKMFGTNQIQVEHRYFANSKPSNLNWTHLNIEQAAADFHNITIALKHIYPQNWVNTGASKGGMTSVFHRYFYPNDVTGTVADVAPLSFSTEDNRYSAFVNAVGGTQYQACRRALEQLQIDLLKQRDKIVPGIKGKFTHLGSSDIAFEHAVLESSFVFWQYEDPSSCKSIPTGKNAQSLYQFLDQIIPLDNYTDSSILEFMPYYFQSATQLGGPDTDISFLHQWIKYTYSVDQYIPKNIPYKYSNEAMTEIDNWVRYSADNILFVYGEFDPWTAGQFPVSQTGKSVHKMFVPEGNHSAKYTLLNPKDRSDAIELIALWLNKRPISKPFKLTKEQTLEDLEFQFRKTHRLNH